MKKISIKAALPVLCMLLIADACKKTNNNSSSGSASDDQATIVFTIDGDSYQNKTISIQGAKGSANSKGIYFSGSDFTGIQVSDEAAASSNGKTSFFLYFDGKNTGSQQCGASFKNQDGAQTIVNFGFTLYVDGDAVDYGFDYSAAGSVNSETAGLVTIKNYGEVNKSIDGDFSGTLINTTTGEKVKITAGHFHAPRHKDIPL